MSIISKSRLEGQLRSRGPGPDSFCPVVVCESERRIRLAARRRILGRTGGAWTRNALTAFTQFLRARATACERCKR